MAHGPAHRIYTFAIPLTTCELFKPAPLFNRFYIKRYLVEMVTEIIMPGQTIQPPRTTHPDITYAPDYDKYQARTQRRLATESLPDSLPPGFPSHLSSPLAWTGANIASSYNWNYTLSTDDIAEIDGALQHFESLDRPIAHVNATTFPLPKLHATLRSISYELHNGHGFKVLRGIPVEKYTRTENLIIYGGISSHIAPIRGRQDNQYAGKPADVVLNHIKDLRSSVTAGARIGAPAYTADKQVFHTDSGDVVALFCLEPAAEGGKSKIASNWAVYNELAATRPDLVHTLSEQWPTEVFGHLRQEDKEKGYVMRPVLFHLPGTDSTPERIIIQYARRTFTGYMSLPRGSSTPPITEAQAEALDALHFTAERLSVDLDFQKGDIQFLNNLAMFHARDAFVDDAEETGKKRHLVRLWLRDPDLAWPMPDELWGRWQSVFGGREDSDAVSKEVWPLEPFVRSAAAGTARK